MMGKLEHHIELTKSLSELDNNEAVATQPSSIDDDNSTSLSEGQDTLEAPPPPPPPVKKGMDTSPVLPRRSSAINKPAAGKSSSKPRGTSLRGQVSASNPSIGSSHAVKLAKIAVERRAAAKAQQQQQSSGSGGGGAVPSLHDSKDSLLSDSEEEGDKHNAKRDRSPITPRRKSSRDSVAVAAATLPPRCNSQPRSSVKPKNSMFTSKMPPKSSSYDLDDLKARGQLPTGWAKVLEEAEAMAAANQQQKQSHHHRRSLSGSPRTKLHLRRNTSIDNDRNMERAEVYDQCDIDSVIHVDEEEEVEDTKQKHPVRRKRSPRQRVSLSARKASSRSPRRSISVDDVDELIHMDKDNSPHKQQQGRRKRSPKKFSSVDDTEDLVRDPTVWRRRSPRRKEHIINNNSDNEKDSKSRSRSNSRHRQSPNRRSSELVEKESGPRRISPRRHSTFDSKSPPSLSRSHGRGQRKSLRNTDGERMSFDLEDEDDSSLSDCADQQQQEQHLSSVRSRRLRGQQQNVDINRGPRNAKSTSPPRSSMMIPQPQIKQSKTPPAGRRSIVLHQQLPPLTDPTLPPLKAGLHGFDSQYYPTKPTSSAKQRCVSTGIKSSSNSKSKHQRSISVGNNSSGNINSSSNNNSSSSSPLSKTTKSVVKQQKLQAVVAPGLKQSIPHKSSNDWKEVFHQVNVPENNFGT